MKSGAIALFAAACLFALFALGTGCRNGQSQGESANPGGAGAAVHHPNHPPEQPAPEFEGPPLSEFTLTNTAGSEFGSEELKGEVWVASFFFTRCAANCRALNMKISELQREFGDDGVQFVCISCDPEYDTPKVLASYAEMYNARPEKWHFLTGEMDYIRRVGHDKFDVAVAEQRHEDELLVVDRHGQTRGKFRARQPEQFERLKALLVELLAEPGEAAPNGDLQKDPAPGPSSDSSQT